MSPRGSHPHVLVLMCDQMQHSRMGAVDGIAHTPTLDRLIGEGVRFSNAITCHGQCAPARAAFQTGRYPHECGVMANAGEQFGHQHATLGPQHRTIGHAFADAGYHTAYFGKSHLYVPLEKLGYEDSFEQDGLAVPDDEAERLGIRYVPNTLRRNYVSIEEAVEFLDRWEPAGRPLFFTFSTNLPHPPFFHEESYRELFPPDEMPLPETYADEHFADKPPYQKQHVGEGRHGAGGEDDVRDMVARYYSMIAAMDAHFGRVVAAFDRLGIWDDTLVLFLADHGDMMGAHGIRKKGTLPYDELYRIPCVLKLPAGTEPARRTVTDLVGSVHLPAALLELAGVSAPPSFRRADVPELPFRTEPAPERDRAVFFEHYAAYWGTHPFYGIRTPRHKYVRYYGPDDTEELYDLAEDPGELRNLAAGDRHRELRRQLAERADRWWRESDGRDFAHYDSPDFRAGRHNRWEQDWTRRWKSAAAEPGGAPATC